MTTSKGVSLAARKRFRLTSDDLWGYAFIGVSMLVFCIFTLYPVISAVETSFLKYRPFGSQYIKWQNYAETFKNALFYKATKNTLVYTAVVVPLSLLLAFSIAIMILPFPRKAQSVFKSIYYLPGIASGVALSVVWLWIYDSSPQGLSLMFMALMSGQGSNIIIYIAALLGIDNSYFEAAELDGATFMQKVRYIVFPLVKPTTLFLLVTGVIGSFQVFMNAFMMTGGGPDNSTTMIGLLIYKNAFEYSKYGLACAQAILLAIVIASSRSCSSSSWAWMWNIKEVGIWHLRACIRSIATTVACCTCATR